jgi:serine/threonine protein kinase
MPISASQMAELQAARQQGMRAEADRERKGTGRVAQQPMAPPMTPASPAGVSSDVSASRSALPASATALDLAAGGTATSNMKRLTAPLSGAPKTQTPPPPPARVAPDGARQERADRETLADDDDDEKKPPSAVAKKAPEKLDAGDESSTPKKASWDSVHDAEPDAPPAAAVASFGEYEILAEVARGGMGIVYKARRRGTQKVLALKVLISGVDATEEQVRRFEMEGEAARKIRHPGIVKIYDAARHEGYHYIAMEYVDGPTLELVLSKGALEPRRAARIMRDLARAVHEIHKAKIVHRDLKPGNIILNDADEPKLIDFGLAKAIDRRAKLTRSGAAIGTPYYMPPEQVRGEADKIGPASDVYAIGAIFFEMLSGEVPFKADNPIELYHKIASSELVLPEALKTDKMPDALVSIIGRCMEKRVEDRYASAEALANDLDLFLGGKNVAVPKKKAAKKKPGEASASRLVLFALAGIVVGLLVVAVLATAWLKLEGPQSEARALQQKGRAALLEKRTEHAKVYFEDALRLTPGDPTLEVDLARVLAPADPALALAALERAAEKGLKDASLLDAAELQPLAKEKRFLDVQAKVRTAK